MSEDEYRFLVEQVYKVDVGVRGRQGRERVSPPAMDIAVPASNIALFRKHEADIKKYAMSGLEWIGL
jgi:hypothetical protein